MERKFTKDEVIAAIKQEWIKEFGRLSGNKCDCGHDVQRDGYFVAGFVEISLDKYEKTLNDTKI